MPVAFSQYAVGYTAHVGGLMKKFLKLLAFILVIIAVIAILYAGFTWYQSGLTFTKFAATTAFGSLSWGLVIGLAVVGLVVAAVISPKGAAKAFDRIGHATSVAAKGVTKVISKTAAGAIGGLLTGLFSHGLLPVLAVAGLVYWFWPDKDELRQRRDAQLASDLRVQEAEAQARIESERAARNSSRSGAENVTIVEAKPVAS